MIFFVRLIIIVTKHTLSNYGHEWPIDDKETQQN